MNRRTFLAALGCLGTASLLGCSTDDQGADYVPDPDALQVYSSQHQNLTKAWADAFTKKTGVAVQIRPGQDASWIVCYGCDLSSYADAKVWWQDDEGISIAQLVP